jgi:hypothetical protein
MQRAAQKVEANMWRHWVKNNLTYIFQGEVALLSLGLAISPFGVLLVRIVASIAFLLTIAGIGVQLFKDRASEQRIKALESNLATIKSGLARAQGGLELVTEYSIPYALRSNVYDRDSTGMPSASFQSLPGTV